MSNTESTVKYVCKLKYKNTVNSVYVRCMFGGIQ